MCINRHEPSTLSDSNVTRRDRDSTDHYQVAQSRGPSRKPRQCRFRVTLTGCLDRTFAFEPWFDHRSDEGIDGGSVEQLAKYINRHRRIAEDHTIRELDFDHASRTVISHRRNRRRTDCLAYHLLSDSANRCSVHLICGHCTPKTLSGCRPHEELHYRSALACGGGVGLNHAAFPLPPSRIV